MATSGIVGFGATFGNDTPALVGEVISIDISGPTIDDVEFYSMDAVAGYASYKAGKRDGGTVTIEFIFHKTDVNTVEGWLGTSDGYVVTFPDASTFTFTGYCKSLSMSIPVDDKITATAEFKVSDQPTFT